MSKIVRFFILCILVLASFMGMTLNVWANNIEETRERHRLLLEQIAAEQSSLADTRSEIRSVNEELAELEYQLAGAADVLTTILFNLELTKLELEYAEFGLQEAKEARDTQFEAFSMRVRHVYMNGWAGYIDAILNAESFMDFFNRIDHVNRMVEFDRNLVEELKRAEEAISEQVSIIQEREDMLLILEGTQIERMREYDELLEHMVAIRIELELTEEGQAAALAEMEEDRAEFDRIIAEYDAQRAREEAARVAREQQEALARAATTPVASDNQTLQWPLPGHSRITSHFGNRSDPFTGRTAFHSGLDVGAPFGVNIVAAESGTVIFSGWQGGYGNTVIIDHGNGKHTMYAHASSLLVRAGHNVNRGQAIARVGSTGRSTGNHLHFEVRVNGSLVNPLNFTSPR